MKCQVKGKTTIGAGVGKKENLLLSGTSFDCVEELYYLGDMLSSELLEVEQGSVTSEGQVDPGAAPPTCFRLAGPKCGWLGGALSTLWRRRLPSFAAANSAR